MSRQNAPRYAVAIYLAALLLIGGYFSLASVQGEFGLFRRVQIESEISQLAAVRDALKQEVASMSIKTRRLSDDYLDLDLLDAQARDILGLVHRDEIVIH